MIVALASIDHQAGASSLARELAKLRAAAGKVLLAPHAHAPGQLDLPYDDVVFDASDDDPNESESVFSTASVIIVLMDPAALQAQQQEPLLKRIKCALDSNPQVQVLVALRHTKKALAPHEVGSILAFVARISSARLADTLVLDDIVTYRPLQRQFEQDERYGAVELSAARVRHLYHQVFSSAPAPGMGPVTRGPKMAEAWRHAPAVVNDAIG